MNDIETFMASVRAELDALRHDNQTLRTDNQSLQDHLAELRTVVAGTRAGTGPDEGDHRDTLIGDGAGDAAMTATPLRPVSRRGMIAAVAGAAGGILLTQATPAAAANGDPVKAGMTTNATASTIVSTTSGYGLQGLVNTGTGVYGRSESTTGSNIGVGGYAAATSGYGVYGRAAAASGVTYGVYGANSSSSGTGVMGNANAASGTTYGVYGKVMSAAGYALYGEGRLKVSGRSYLATPNSAPVDSDLGNGSISFYLDQSNNQLKVRVKYSGGATKTGTVNLA